MWCDEALQLCADHGGSLANILSRDEQDAMMAVAREEAGWELGTMDGRAFWIGINDMQEQNSFWWARGDTFQGLKIETFLNSKKENEFPSTYTNWIAPPGESSGHGRKCSEVDPNDNKQNNDKGRWNDHY